MKNNQKIFAGAILIIIVGIAGYFILSKKTVPKDETVNWKTYTNEQYGFEFKSPQDVSISEEEPYYSQSGTQPSNTGSISVGNILHITIFNNGIVENDYDWPERPCGEWSFSPDDGPVSTEHILFKGQKTNRVVSRGYDDNLNVYYCINYSKNPFVVSFNKNNQAIADQVLSTFKFIDPVDTSTWKKYTNTRYGFELKYPSFMEELDISKITNGAIGFISLCYNDYITCFSYPVEHLSGVYGFEGAAVTVNIIKESSSKEICENTSESYPDKLPERYSTNGITFSLYDFGDAATGHTTQGTEFHTFHNSQCYNVKIGVDNYRCDVSESYDPKTNTTFCKGHPEVNDAMILDELKQVVSTFKFTK